MIKFSVHKSSIIRKIDKSSFIEISIVKSVKKLAYNKFLQPIFATSGIHHNRAWEFFDLFPFTPSQTHQHKNLKLSSFFTISRQQTQHRSQSLMDKLLFCWNHPDFGRKAFLSQHIVDFVSCWIERTEGMAVTRLIVYDKIEFHFLWGCRWTRL